MLLRRYASRARCLLAELQECPNRIAKVRQLPVLGIAHVSCTLNRLLSLHRHPPSGFHIVLRYIFPPNASSLMQPTSPHSVKLAPQTALADFRVTPRVLWLILMAVVTGTLGVGAAWVLLKLIALTTN